MQFAREIQEAIRTGLATALIPLCVLALIQLPFSGTAIGEHSDRYLGHAKAPLFAAAPPGRRDGAGFSVRVANVLRGDLLEIEDGREFRLAGVLAPLPQGEGKSPARAWPAHEESRAALEALTRGKDLWVIPLNGPADRYGRMAAMIFDGEGRSLHERLLEAGWLRLTGDGSLAEDYPWYARQEAGARSARRGLWAYRAYQVWPAADADRAIGRFGIVEGQVLSAASVRKRLYLNFGSDWRSDFTVMIDGDGRKAFAAAGLDPLSYEGRYLRIRGWIKSYNGAMIEVENPQQIEVLAP